MSKRLLDIRKAIAFTLVVFGLAVGFLAPMVEAAPPHCQSKNVDVYSGIIHSGNYEDPFTGYIIISNKTNLSCSLAGYPGVSAWRNGHTVGNPAKWMKPAPKPVVILGPARIDGDSAIAKFNNLGTKRFPADQCKPLMVHQIKIYVPNSGPGEGPAHLNGWYFKTCQTTKYFNLQVWPFKPYHSGQLIR